MLYIIDTYAWVEYFLGSVKGEVLKKLFEDEKHRFFTVECCLAEIKAWALQNNKDFDVLFKIVRSNSSILPLTEHNWIDAASARFEQRKERKNFGMIDAILLVKQKEYSCMIVTGDKHFKGLNETIFLE